MNFRKKNNYFVGIGEAFSLVEVTISLGLISFCLVALLGLFHVGLQQERRSVDQTRAAFILSAVVDDISGTGRRPGTATVSTETVSANYGIDLPAFGGEVMEKTITVDASGKPSVSSGDNSYVVHIRIEPPSQSEGLFIPYKMRVCIAWPSVAEFQGSGTSLQLLKASGSIETIMELNRG